MLYGRGENVMCSPLKHPKIISVTSVYQGPRLSYIQGDVDLLSPGHMNTIPEERDMMIRNWNV